MPNFNYRPESVLFFDMETQSGVNLRDVGSTIYLRHPTTRIMSCVLLDEEDCYLWIPHGVCKYPVNVPCDRRLHLFRDAEIPHQFVDLMAHTWVAHNAENFDSIAWERLVTCEREPQWFDTVHPARASGYPGGLDALGLRLLGKGKDTVGRDAMLMLTKWHPKKGYPVGTPMLWEQMLAYNIKDCVDLEQIFYLVHENTEQDVLEAHSAINSRGFKADLSQAELIGSLWGSLRNEATKRIEELRKKNLVIIDNIASVQQVKNWLASQGCFIDSLNKSIQEELFAHPENFLDDEGSMELVVEVLKLRQQATRVSDGKIKTLIELADDDGRVRNAIVYWGAGATGRYSSRGIQLHNMPKGLDNFDTQDCIRDLLADDDHMSVIDSYAHAHSAPRDQVLTSLFRSIFEAKPLHKLLVADYAAIEARGVAWVAGETKLLDIFNADGDVYLDFGGTLYGRPIGKKSPERFVSKQCVLGFGYGMSDAKFEMMCQAYHIDLEKAGVTALHCKNTYRKTFPRIPLVWRACGKALVNAMKNPNKEFHAAKSVFRFDGSTLRITLPSGRTNHYRDARIELRTPRFLLLQGKSGLADCVDYLHPYGMRRELYGGLLVENIVQGIARDLLSHSLVLLERNRIPVVAHVHDEIICEVPFSQDKPALRRMIEVMSHPPEWAKGFPIKVEGFCGERYSKGSFDGEYQCEGVNGKITRVKNG